MDVFKNLLSFYVFLRLLQGVCGFAVNSTSKKCSDDHFPCDNGDCVQKSRWCDYEADCSDDSDETFCAKVSYGFFSSGDPNDCRDDHFHCVDGPCIPEVGRCDGVPSCDDFSDEDYCEVLDVAVTTEMHSTRDAISYTTKSIPTENSTTVKSTSDIHHLEPQTAKSAVDIHLEPQTAKSAVDIDHLEPQTVKSAVDMNHFEPQTAKSAVDIHLEPQTAKSAVDIHHLEPQTAKSAVDIHHLEPQTVKSAVDIDHLEPQTVKSAVDIDHLEPQTVKSAVDMNHFEPQTVKSALDMNNLEPHTTKSASYTNLQLDIVKSTEDGHHIQLETRVPINIPIFKQKIEIPEPKNGILDSLEPKMSTGEPRIEILDPLEPRNSIKQKELVEISEELRYVKQHLKLLNRTLHELKLEYPVQTAFLRVHQPTEPALGHILSKTLLQSRQMAERWLLEQRHADWGWGEETARVIVALTLSNPQFSAEDSKDGQLMTKELKLQLSSDLLKNESRVMSLCQLSLYINALIATCTNPRNFHGMDLIATLRQRTDTDLRKEFVNPMVYFTLCLGEETTVNDVNKLQELIFTQNELLKGLDIQALALLAVSCVARLHRYSITKLQNEAVNRLLYQHSNGTFGNIYTTALMVQALTAANADSHWNRRNSLNFLLHRQEEDGSFGDILATYYILPSLAGRSLLSLKEIACPNIPDGKKGLIPLDVLKNSKKPSIYVELSLYMKIPVEVTNTLKLKVAENTTFLDVMRLAQEKNPFFRFKYSETSSGAVVYSIAGLPNDAERGIYWILDNNNDGKELLAEDTSTFSTYKQDIRQLIPKDGEKFVFWYKRLI